MKQRLTDEQLDIAKHIGFTKLVRRMTKYYNRLCPACRMLVTRKPKDAFHTIGRCNNCKDIIGDAETRFTK